MAAIREFNLVKLFIGVLVSNPKFVSEAEQLSSEHFGAIDHRSEVIPFAFTNYYEKEMGPSLHRIFFSFEKLIDAERLPEIKRKTNGLELELAALETEVSRPVNLDPGYIENAKVILASTKNFYHRMYLGGGIFGEVTIHFRHDGCEFFPWTYPDYQTEAYQRFFLAVRRLYRTQLRKMCMVKRS